MLEQEELVGTMERGSGADGKKRTLCNGRDRDVLTVVMRVGGNGGFYSL